MRPRQSGSIRGGTTAINVEREEPVVDFRIGAVLPDRGNGGAQRITKLLVTLTNGVADALAIALHIQMIAAKEGIICAFLLREETFLRDQGVRKLRNNAPEGEIPEPSSCEP